MNTYTLESFRAGDGYIWRYRRYEPATAPRGHLVCIHGIQSHAGWYEYSCGKYAEAGYRVTFIDRRGAGMNMENRGDAPSFRRLLVDLAEFLHREAAESLPTFLLAISWGGKLATALQRYAPAPLHGLILICPGFFGTQRPPFVQRLRILFSRLFALRRLFPIPLNEPELFTATPRWQNFLSNDPLRLHEATARLLIESVRLDMYLRWVPRYVTVPVLLLLAGKDRIIFNEPTRRYVDQFANQDRQVIEYADSQHTLEFEPEPDRHITDILNWLERHLPASKGTGR